MAHPFEPLRVLEQRDQCDPQLRDEAALEAATGRLTDHRARGEQVVLDITDAAALEALRSRMQAEGSLRSVVHAAGISPTMADWRRILDVDLVGTARVLAALRPLVAPGTAIVCMASMAAHLAVSPNAEADRAVDAPLAADLADRYLAALGTAGADPANAYGWAKRGVQRLVRRSSCARSTRRPRLLDLARHDRRANGATRARAATPHEGARGTHPASPQRHRRGHRRRG